MNFNLFLFDADDTLFDFGESELLSLQKTFEQYQIEFSQDLYKTYKEESGKLWRQLELGQTTKDFLQVERFKRTFSKHKIKRDCDEVSDLYLDLLPETVVLNPYALEICDFLNKVGEVAIITNGIKRVQHKRLERSGLKDKIKFMVVSEDCGYAKPDKKFFDYTMKKGEIQSKEGVLVIGDRLETDIEGAYLYGLDSCWYNPQKKPAEVRNMDYEISSLEEIKNIVSDKV